MRRALTTLVFTLGTGLVTWALSERAFWGRLRPDDSVPDSLVTLAAYTAVTYLGLVAVRRLAVADARRLFLVGALVGWVVEGMVVGTLYGLLPLSVSWTALAWHAPISVVAGWHLVPAALRRGGRRAWTAAAGGGAALGAWSAFMSVDAGGAPDAARAAVTAAIVAGALATGYALQARCRPGDGALRMGTAAGVVAGLAVVWASLAVVPAVPFAPLVLVPLAVVVLRALRRDAAPVPPGDDAFAVVPGVPAGRLAPLLLLPPAAAAGCLAAAVSHTAPYVGYAVYALATPGGLVLLVLAARRRRVPANGSAAAGREALRM